MFKQRLIINERERTLTHALEQLNRADILGTVAGIRRELQPVDHEGLGRWALSVPYEDWLSLRRRYPDLQAKDGEIRSKAWLVFIRSPESLPYRLHERV